MPITRRRRANPPDQPENNNHVDQSVNAVNADNAADTAGATSSEQPGGTPTDNANDNSVASPTPPASSGAPSAPIPYQASSVTAASSTTGNGDRGEHGDRQEYVPLPPAAPPLPETTSRRTSFRRPMQTPASLPPAPPVSAPPAPHVVAQPPMPNPTHEIALPLGNLLHLAYNPSYTGSSEARSTLLHKLAQETKAGGRARCWNCGSLAIAYDHWSTRSKNFGEVGVAFCEICGVWSVM